MIAPRETLAWTMVGTLACGLVAAQAISLAVFATALFRLDEKVRKIEALVRDACVVL